MRSPCRAPQNSNGNLCAQERVDVSPEHKKNHSHKNKIEEIKPQSTFSLSFHRLTILRRSRSEYPIQNCDYSIMNPSPISADGFSKGRIKWFSREIYLLD